MPFQIDKTWFTKDNLQKMIDFLVNDGWEARPSEHGGAVIYSKRDSTGYEVTFSLPVLERLNIDSVPMLHKVSNIVEVLADFYGKEPDCFFYGVIQQKEVMDAVLMKLKEGENVDSIPLQDFGNLLDGWRDLMLNMWQSMKKQGDVSNLLGQCRLSHSFPGSYGIKLYVPFRIQYRLNIEENEPVEIPTERRVLEKVFETFGILSKNDDVNVATKLLIESCKGFPSICEHVRKIVGKIDDSGVVFELIPAKEIPLSPGIPHEAIRIRNKMIIPIDEAINSFVAIENESSSLKTIAGIVMGIERGEKRKSINEDEKRTIKIFSEELNATVKINNVELEDYFKAMDAHKSNSKISVSGTLTRSSSSYYLISNAIFLAD